MRLPAEKRGFGPVYFFFFGFAGLGSGVVVQQVVRGYAVETGDLPQGLQRGLHLSGFIIGIGRASDPEIVGGLALRNAQLPAKDFQLGSKGHIEFVSWFFQNNSPFPSIWNLLLPILQRMQGQKYVIIEFK